MRVERIGISTDVTGSANTHSKANMDRQSNEEMEVVMQAIIHRIQTVFHCVVVKLSTGFVQDANGRVWFLCTDQCLCASERLSDR